MLWVSVRIQKSPEKRGFPFMITIPLFLLSQWAEMAEDIFDVIRIFPSARRKLDETSALEILSAVQRAVRELPHIGPEKLADIDVEKSGMHRVRVKCLLR